MPSLRCGLTTLATVPRHFLALALPASLTDAPLPEIRIELQRGATLEWHEPNGREVDAGQLYGRKAG